MSHESLLGRGFDGLRVPGGRGGSQPVAPRPGSRYLPITVTPSCYLTLLAGLAATLAVPASSVRAQGGISEMEAFRGRALAARQHLLVITEAPGDIRGQLYRMEWGPDEGEAGGVGGRGEEPAWRWLGGAVQVVVGWGGVGAEREGDGRSPRGVFELGPAFGFAPEPPPGLGLAYDAMSPDTGCVDDAASALYNRVFDPDTLPGRPDWTSAEAMRRDLARGDAKPILIQGDRGWLEELKVAGSLSYGLPPPRPGPETAPTAGYPPGG